MPDNIRNETFRLQLRFDCGDDCACYLFEMIDTEREPRTTARSIYRIPDVTDHNSNNNNINNNEIGDGLGDNGFTIARDTPIQDFYAGQSVFITGGTGFLGKILIEKLLRSCPKISRIYLLIRNKKNKNLEDRLQESWNNSLYDGLREASPKFRDKIVGIAGDCGIRGLGLSATDRERLSREVSIVFHCGATVHFNEKLNVALRINVGGSLDMMDLCRRMDKLKAFIHVSTVYANCHQSKVEESFYPHAFAYEDLEKLLDGLTDEKIEEITPKIIKNWPNTYSFTKALAEVLIKERSKDLVMGIFRPAIITSCAYEPKPGWTDNSYGPTGAMVGIARGIIRSIELGSTSRANVIPVDLTVNALIASAWNVANQPDRREEKMMIFNYVSSTADYSITWEQFCRINIEHAKEYPLSDAKWAVNITVHNSKMTSMLGRMFLHYAPAVFVDFCYICLGYPPMLVNAYKKIHKSANAQTWGCTHDWIFVNNNVVKMWQELDPKDQQIFRFNIKDLDWDSYFRNFMKGIRLYLLKDDLSSLEASRRRAKRFILMHETMKLLLLTVFFWVLWKIFTAGFI